MPWFDYTGQLASGAAFDGTIEAASHEQAHATLAEMGVHVVTLRPSRQGTFVTPLSLDEFTFFNEQLTSLTQANMPIEDGLRHLAADVGSRRLKRLLLDLARALSSGSTLEQALEQQRTRFPVGYPQVVRAGLSTGDLAGTLHGLTAHLRLRSDLRRALVELLTYPLLVITVALIVASYVMRNVMPILHEMWGQFIRDAWPSVPPLPSVFKLVPYWPYVEAAFIVLLAGAVLLGLITWLPFGRSLREPILRRLPGLGQIYRASAFARFAHTSALAAAAGTPLPQLVASSGAASGSTTLASAAHRVADAISNGKSVQEAARDEPEIPPLWTCVVTVAAARGDLPTALAELARGYELRAKQWTITLRTLLGPLLFFVLSLLLGSLIVVLASAAASVLSGLSSALTFF